MPDRPKRLPIFRYIFGGLAVVALLVVLFYQPIVFGLAQLAAQQFAKSQKLSLSFMIHGSIFTDLFLEDVHLSASPENQTFPIEKLDAKVIGARYNLWSFLQKDYRQIVDLVRLKNVDLVLRSGGPPPPQQKPSGPLRIPPIIPRQIEIENVNVRVKGKPEDILVQGSSLNFGQDQTGTLSVSRLSLPPLGDWTDVRAQISERQGVINLRGLRLPPLLVVDNLGVDLSQLDNSTVGAALQGSFFDAPLEAQLRFHQAETDSSARLKLTDLDLAKTKSLTTLPLQGRVPTLEANLSGDLEQPNTWSGTLRLAAANLTYLTYSLDSLELLAEIVRGSGELRHLLANSGHDRISVVGRFALPMSLDAFPAQSTADLGFQLAVPEPARFLAGAEGSLTGSGTIGLNSGHAQTRINASALGFRLANLAVASTDVQVYGAARIPIGGDDVWKSLGIIANAQVREAQAAPAKIPILNASVDALDGNSAHAVIQALSGESKIQVNVQSVLPTAAAPFDPKQLSGQAEFHIDSLTDFTMESLVSGEFTADGKLTVRDMQPDGYIRAKGNQLQYQTFTLPHLAVDATAQGGKADVRDLELSFDEANLVKITGTATFSDPQPYQATGTIQFADLGVLDQTLMALHQPTGLKGTLQGNFQAKGSLGNKFPQAKLQLRGRAISYRGVIVKEVQAEGDTANGSAELRALRLAFDDRNTITANATAALSVPYAYHGHADVDLQDLGVFRGFLTTLGKAGEVNGKLQATVEATGDNTTRLPRAQVKAAGQQIKAYGLLVQGLDLNADSSNTEAFLRDLKITFDPNNKIDVNGSGSAQEPYAYQAQGSLNFSDLRTFNDLLKAFGQDPGLVGKMDARFNVHGDSHSKLPAGDLSLVGDHLRYRGLTIQQVDTAGQVQNNELSLPTFRVVIDSKNRLDAHGSAGLLEPYPYQSDANVALEDLSFLNPLLQSFGQNGGVGGRLSLVWRGKGELKNSDGELQLHADRLSVGNINNIKADVEGSYHGAEALFSRVNVNSPYADFAATLRINPELAEIPNLTIRKNQNVLTGNVSLPLNFRPGAKVPIALDKPLAVNLRGDRIPLAAFQSGKPQVTGNIDLLVQASGALRDLNAKVHLGASDLRSSAVSSLAAARTGLDVQLANKNLTVVGDFTQPDIQPAQIRGSIPLDLQQVIETGKLREDTPLQLSVKWPDTNLAFAKKIVPQIQIIEGRVAIDANVSGTLQTPQLTGGARANISRFRARTDTVPPISNFLVNVNFRQNRITFDQFNGLAGGGPFGVRGAIDLSKGTDPVFDLRITGRQVLVTRSDNIIVRSNLDLAVRGPLSAGEVSGNVGVTNSRFFQEIDILPLNLPGRPAPSPPAVAPPSAVSIQTPPLNNWKFNIDVKTDQLFRVESNVARGAVTINLHIGGTGGAPSVTGFVRIDNLVASLPFSHLNISNGFVNFPPGGNPLDPVLNIVGMSQVRDYDIRVRVFGNVSNFQILFDSTPPLAQGDIATLLATGATTGEFVDNPSLLAGRATFILAQQLLTKVFKLRSNQNQQAFLERLQVDIIPGSRPGTQDVSARFALTKNWQIIGDVGQQGDVSGRLRYLIRFR
jgi:autotransporter translocation and assembly factor TamB